MRFNGICAALAAAVICCPSTLQAAPPDTGIKPRTADQSDAAVIDARRIIAKKREQSGEPEAIFGACCFENGECHVIGIVGCVLCGGEFQGFGTACEDVDCGDDQTQPVTFGACCFDDGSCIECLPFLCCILGGEYQGFGTSCDDACGGRGACCLEDNQCEVTTAEDCAAQGGDFQGAGTLCQPFDVIVVDDAGGLLGGGGSFVYDVTLADNPSSILGVTITFDFDPIEADASWASDARVILSGPNGFAYSIGGFDSNSDVPWPFDGPGSAGAGTYGASFTFPEPADKGDWTIEFVNDWAGDANPNSYTNILISLQKGSICGLDGACCLVDGSCVEASQFDCEEGGGVYQGDGSFCSDVCCVYTIDFETEDDFATPLVNGQDISTAPEFGNKVAINIVYDDSDNHGLAIFDSTPAGPNADGGDPDLLVDSGNLLIIQDWFHPTQSVAGIFDEPNDSWHGGTFKIEMLVPSRLVSVDLVDICNEAGEHAKVTLIDDEGKKRYYEVPAGYTSAGDGGIRTLDLQTLADQAGATPGVFATASEQNGFDADAVVKVRVQLSRSGAIDNLKACNPVNQVPPPPPL